MVKVHVSWVEEDRKLFRSIRNVAWRVCPPADYVALTRLLNDSEAMPAPIFETSPLDLDTLSLATEQLARVPGREFRGGQVLHTLIKTEAKEGRLTRNVTG